MSPEPRPVNLARRRELLALTMAVALGCSGSSSGTAVCVPCPAPLPSCQSQIWAGYLIPTGTFAITQLCGGLTIINTTNGDDPPTCWIAPLGWNGPGFTDDGGVWNSCFEQAKMIRDR